MPVRLGELAVRFGCDLQGDPDVEVDRVATLQDARPGALSFLANPRYRKHLAGTGASAVVLDAASAAQCPTNALIAANPYATYARIAQVLHPEPAFAGGRHPTRRRRSGSTGRSIRVDRCALLRRRPTRSSAHACSSVPAPSSSSGCASVPHSRCVARVTLCAGVQVGERCLFAPGVVLGADGFGQAPDKDGYVKVPQVGAVRIGNDVEIGANTTVDRGAIEDTVIEDGVKIDNQVQVGHNCRIGAHTVIAGCAGISGSVTVGKRCMIGGMVGVVGHLEICDDVYLTGKTMVSHSITKPGLYSGQLPLDEARRFRRNSARFQNLDELARRVQRLERSKRDGDGPEDE